MGAAPSMAMQNAITTPDASDVALSEESEAHDVRRLRWILRVANNPGSCEEWYLGDERDGLRHGQGAAFYTTGDVYNGQWHRGAWHGRGMLTNMSGAKYTGSFEKGEQHGSGEFIDVNGVRFRGEFRRGRRHGHGQLISPDGAMFQGWFRDGLAHGDGCLTWPDGGKFIGKYSAGKEHGRGAILDSMGCKVCDVACLAGVLVGGRTVCPGSLGGGKGPKCRGGSYSCGLCLETALDLELSIEHEGPDALEGLASGGASGTTSRHGSFGSRSVGALSSGSGGSWGGSSGMGAYGGFLGGGGGGGGGGVSSAQRNQSRCVVRVKAKPFSASDERSLPGSGSGGGGDSGLNR